MILITGSRGLPARELQLELAGEGKVLARLANCFNG